MELQFSGKDYFHRRFGDHLGRPAPGFRAGRLSRLYRDRIDQLKASAICMGPFLSSRVDSFRIAMGNDPVSDPRLATDHRAHPRIDQPANASGAALNAIQDRKDIQSDAGCTLMVQDTAKGRTTSN